MRFKVNDIPGSIGRITITGSNIPTEPWKFPRIIPLDIKKHFIIKEFEKHENDFKKFQKDFEKATQWSEFLTFFLSIIKFLFYSPAYLSLIRVLKVQRSNKVIKLLDSQSNYKIFHKSYHKLKWTTSSDHSTLFLDLVEENLGKDKEQKNQNIMNWELTFPLNFKICKRII